MYVYLNKQQIIKLDKIVAILEKKNKKGKKTTIIKTKEGHRYIETGSSATIIKRIEKHNGFLRNYKKE